MYEYMFGHIPCITICEWCGQYIPGSQYVTRGGGKGEEGEGEREGAEGARSRPTQLPLHLLDFVDAVEFVPGVGLRLRRR